MRTRSQQYAGVYLYCCNVLDSAINVAKLSDADTRASFEFFRFEVNSNLSNTKVITSITLHYTLQVIGSENMRLQVVSVGTTGYCTSLI